MNENKNDDLGKIIVTVVLAIIFVIGFLILLSQVIFGLFLILTITFFALALWMDERFLLPAIICFIATIVTFYLGFILSNTPFGQFAVNFFNSTLHPVSILFPIKP